MPTSTDDVHYPIRYLHLLATAACEANPCAALGEHHLHMSKNRRINWPFMTLTLLVLYWAALAVATHLPAVVVPRTRLTDKSIHFIAFFGLSVLLGAAWASRRPWGPRVALSVVTTIAVYAALDELTQGLIPGRYPDLRDWYYDVGGAVAAVVLLSLGNAVWRLAQRSPPEPQP